MRKIYRTISLILAIMSVVLCFTGCEGLSSTTSDILKTSSGQDKAKSFSSISIKDIDWEVAEGIVDGERYVLLDYTNKSKYIIVGFELQFKEKSNITEAEASQYFTDMQQRFSASVSEIEELKTIPIAMHADSELVTKKDETASAIYCYYYSGYYYVKNISHYSLVVPDIATIKYIDGDTVKTVYYDYSTKKYTEDKKTEPAYYWTENALENVVPKPKADYVKSDGRDDDTCFMFTVYGWTKAQFEDYVKQCKELGFTLDPAMHDGFYSADNSSGYNVYLYYEDDDCYMSAIISNED